MDKYVETPETTDEIQFIHSSTAERLLGSTGKIYEAIQHHFYIDGGLYIYPNIS